MKRSGRVLDVEIHGFIVQSGVLYGGREGVMGRIPEQYAFWVHERPIAHRIGQHHYLSLPTFAATSGMLARIAEQLRNAL